MGARDWRNWKHDCGFGIATHIELFLDESTSVYPEGVCPVQEPSYLHARQLRAALLQNPPPKSPAQTVCGCVPGGLSALGQDACSRNSHPILPSEWQAAIVAAETNSTEDSPLEVPFMCVCKRPFNAKLQRDAHWYSASNGQHGKPPDELPIAAAAVLIQGTSAVCPRYAATFVLPSQYLQDPSSTDPELAAYTSGVNQVASTWTHNTPMQVFGSMDSQAGIDAINRGGLLPHTIRQRLLSPTCYTALQAVQATENFAQQTQITIKPKHTGAAHNDSTSSDELKDRDKIGNFIADALAKQIGSSVTDEDMLHHDRRFVGVPTALVGVHYLALGGMILQGKLKQTLKIARDHKAALTVLHSDAKSSLMTRLCFLDLVDDLATRTLRVALNPVQRSTALRSAFRVHLPNPLGAIAQSEMSVSVSRVLDLPDTSLPQNCVHCSIGTTEHGVPFHCKGPLHNYEHSMVCPSTEPSRNNRDVYHSQFVLYIRSFNASWTCTPPYRLRLIRKPQDQPSLAPS